MTKVEAVIDELVTANRVLAREGIVDSFGHPSIRHPDRPDRFFISRARAPDLIEPSDIMETNLDGSPTDKNDARKPYLERYIHGAIYEVRPEVKAVIHNHSPSVLPFSVTKKKLKPLHHMCGCVGHDITTWDSQTKFGDTSLLISSMEMGRDLARHLGNRPAALMRGHGCVVAAKDIREAVYIAYYLELGAKLQMQAMQIGGDDVKYLSKGEVDTIIERTGPYSFNRAWENWCRRAGRKMLERPDEVVELKG